MPDDQTYHCRLCDQWLTIPADAVRVSSRGKTGSKGYVLFIFPGGRAHSLRVNSKKAGVSVSPEVQRLIEEQRRDASSKKITD